MQSRTGLRGLICRAAVLLIVSLERVDGFRNFARACGSNGNEACPVQASRWSGLGGPPMTANDGVTDGTYESGSCFATVAQTRFYWRLDMQKQRNVGFVKIWHYNDDPLVSLQGAVIRVGDADAHSYGSGQHDGWPNTVCGQVQTFSTHSSVLEIKRCQAHGRFLEISVAHGEDIRDGDHFFSRNLGFCEVEVLEYLESTPNSTCPDVVREGLECDENADCVDSNGAFVCECKPGYATMENREGRVCVPLNVSEAPECSDPPAHCVDCFHRLNDGSLRRKDSCNPQCTFLELARAGPNTLMPYDKAFREMSSLRALDLAANGYDREVPARAFADLRCLKVLDLSWNRFSGISKHAFVGLDSLEELNLEANNIIAIDGAFDKLPMLRKLSLHRNELERLPPSAFSANLHLKDVDLSDLSSLLTLKDVNPQAFSGLDDLDKLDLTGQFFIKDWNFLSGFKRIHHLILEATDISDTSTLAGVHVTILELGESRIADLSDLDVSELTWLSLRETEQLLSLSSLPRHTSNLRSLDMSHGGITALSSADFAPMSNLESLELSGCQALLRIPSGCFSSQSNLWFLGLRYMSESLVVEPGAFVGLHNLTSLHLNGFHVNAFQPGSFTGLSNLTSLHWSGLRGTMLGAGLFTGLSALKKFVISSGNAQTGSGQYCKAWTDDDIGGGYNYYYGGYRRSFEDYAYEDDEGGDGYFYDGGYEPGALGGDGVGNVVSEMPSGRRASSGYGLQIINPSTFAELGSLKELSIIHHTALTSISAGAFFGLERLEELQMYHNRIERLDGGMLEGLGASLVVLNCSFNKISDMATSTFANVPNLDKLELGHNDLTLLQQFGFASLTKLSFLSLRNNKFQELQPGALDGLTSLHTLDLHGTTAAIPAGLLQNLAALHTLDLSYWAVAITGFPLQGLGSLHYLSLRGVAFDALDSGGFSHLSSLRSLDLSASTLGTGAAGLVPVGTFEGLDHLEVLTMKYTRETQRTVVAGTFDGLPALTSLDMSCDDRVHIDYWAPMSAASVDDILEGIWDQCSLAFDEDKAGGNHWRQRLGGLPKFTCNPLKIEGGALRGMPQLKTLLLFGRLAKASGAITTAFTLKDALKDVPSLVSLDLSKNNISAFQQDSFLPLAHLEVLDLRQNGLELSDGLFKGLGRLTNLALDENSIPTVPAGAFQGLRNLRYLTMVSCGITSFEPGAFDELVELQLLDLDRNGFTEMDMALFRGQSRPIKFSGIQFDSFVHPWFLTNEFLFKFQGAARNAARHPWVDFLVKMYVHLMSCVPPLPLNGMLAEATAGRTSDRKRCLPVGCPAAVPSRVMSNTQSVVTVIEIMRKDARVALGESLVQTGSVVQRAGGEMCWCFEYPDCFTLPS